MAVAEQSNSGPTSMAMMIDETYEFLAPQFFDFIKGESEDEVCAAELWFETALAYAPSRMFFHSLSFRFNLFFFPMCLLLYSYLQGLLARVSLFIGSL